MAVIRYARQHGTKRAWLTRIMDRRPAKVAAVALAKKADLEMPRDAWAEIHGDAAPEPMKSACTRGRCGLEQRLCGLAVTRLAIS